LAVSEAKRPSRNRFRIETVTNLQRLQRATATPQRTQVSVRVQRPCDGRGPWLAKANGSILVWESLTGTVPSQFASSAPDPASFVFRWSPLSKGGWGVVTAILQQTQVSVRVHCELAAAMQRQWPWPLCWHLPCPAHRHAQLIYHLSISISENLGGRFRSPALRRPSAPCVPVRCMASHCHWHVCLRVASHPDMPRWLL
jgi:hypothetical protein